jgi:hypothetical protein
VSVKTAYVVEETIFIVYHYLKNSSIKDSENVFVETFPNDKIPRQPEFAIRIISPE